MEKQNPQSRQHSPVGLHGDPSKVGFSEDCFNLQVNLTPAKLRKCMVDNESNNACVNKMQT